MAWRRRESGALPPNPYKGVCPFEPLAKEKGKKVGERIGGFAPIPPQAFCKKLEQKLLVRLGEEENSWGRELERELGALPPYPHKGVCPFEPLAKEKGKIVRKNSCRQSGASPPYPHQLFVKSWIKNFW